MIEGKVLVVMPLDGVRQFGFEWREWADGADVEAEKAKARAAGGEMYTNLVALGREISRLAFVAGKASDLSRHDTVHDATERLIAIGQAVIAMDPVMQARNRAGGPPPGYEE